MIFSFNIFWLLFKNRWNWDFFTDTCPSLSFFSCIYASTCSFKTIKWFSRLKLLKIQCDSKNCVSVLITFTIDFAHCKKLNLFLEIYYEIVCHNMCFCVSTHIISSNLIWKKQQVTYSKNFFHFLLIKIVRTKTSSLFHPHLTLSFSPNTYSLHLCFHSLLYFG